MNFSKRNMAVSDAFYKVTAGEARWPLWTVAKAVREGYQISGWVYKAVATIAKHGSTVPIVVFNRDGEIEWNHPITRLLQHPHPYLTKAQLFELLISWLELCGNAYFKKVGTDTTTKELWPISPDRIAPIPSNDMGEFVSGYEIIDSRGSRVQSEEYTKDNVMHIALMNPANPLEGIGPLQAAARPVDLDNSQQDWNLSTMQNRGVVDGVFTFKKDLTREQGDSILTRIKEKITGVTNAREPLVLGSEANYTRLGLTSVELDFLMSRKFNREEILGIFGVPPQLVGSQDAATYSNFSNAMRVFWEATVLPLVDTLVDQFNFAFREELQDGYYVGYDKTNIAALRTSEQEHAAIAKNYWDMGVPISSINEKLELGIQEFPLWDESWTGAPPNGGGGTEELPEEGRAVKLTLLETRSPEAEAARRDEVAEGPLTSMLSELFTAQQADVFKALDAGEDPADAVRLSHDTWYKALSDAATRIAYDFAGTVAVDDRGAPLRWERREIDPAARELLDEVFQSEAWILEELSHIEINTIGLILDQVAAAADSGASIQDLRRAILDTGAFSEERALRIARTVAGTASSVGQITAAKLAGAEEKTWSTSRFEVREAHIARSGETVPIDGVFSSQISSIGPRFPCDPRIAAGDRINCRCYLTFG